MLQNRYVLGGLIIVVLLVANIIRFFLSGWGLITVRAHEVPLGQIVKSIEHQGWVTIYTNIDPTTPVSMDVIKVPLAEAMESLAANIPPPENTGGGPPGGGGGGPRGGGGGGAQWKLAFFTAPTSAGVKEEIRAFQGGGVADDDTKIYSFPTPLQMLSSDSGMPAADPRLQIWPGLKTPAAAPVPAAGDSSQDSQSQQGPPSTAQDYLQALAQSADIWIMAPSSWEPKISGPPSSGSLIGHAVKSLVGSANGAMEQAFILYTRPPGQRGGGGGRRGFAGGDTGWSTMEDRMRNAINGLPAAVRADANDQLTQEVNFQKQVRAAPPEQRRDMMRQHFMNRLGANDWRRSPERRAQMYQRAVANRQSVRGK